MKVEIDFTDEDVNTQFAPLAALGAFFHQVQTFQPLLELQIPAKKREFSPIGKLLQVMLSILTGCNTLSEVNTVLSTERKLARAWGWPRFADQSTLSRQLDQLTLKQLEQIRIAITQIWRSFSQAFRHDFRAYLWLDYDFSPLPCGPKAEASQKGCFGEGKKGTGAS